MVHLVHVAFEGPVLALLVDKALDMDVEIKINNEGAVGLDTAATTSTNDDNDQDMAPPASLLEEKRSKRTFQQMSQGTPPTVVVGKAITPIKNPESSIINLATETAASANEANHVIEISERLDILMTVLYQRISQITRFTPGSLSSAMAAVMQARRLYRQLDGVFDEKVRTTDRCKFVQFVFFVLFGRENDALDEVGRILAKREKEMPHTAFDIVDPDHILSTSSCNVTDPLYRGFSAKLIDFFYNPSHVGDDFPRQTVVCYLASFVSRAVYVCPETVCECVAALLRWAEAYISAQTDSIEYITPSKGDGVSRISSGTSLGSTRHPCEIHALFYTACQAAFYIMCFRGAEALKYYRRSCKYANNPESTYADPDSVDIGPERWKLICGHALQPLTYCLESVRVEFLHLSEDLNLFVNCYDTDDIVEDEKESAMIFIEHLWSSSSVKQRKQMPHGPNKIKHINLKRRKSTIISTAATQEKKRLDGGVGGLGQGSNPLDSFFPFDPYLLQQSYIHVHSYYRNWEDCILSIDDENESGHYEEGLLDENSGSDISVPDDDGGDAVDEDEEGSIDDEDAADDISQGSSPSESLDQVPPSTEVESLYEDSRFEMEIKRSRAMSTGSQCSW